MLVRNRTGKKDGDHQERGCYRTLDEDAGYVHLCCLCGAGALPVGPFTSTLPPFLSLSAPSTTTSSSADRPDVIDAFPSWLMPMVTGRISAVWSAFDDVDEGALLAPLDSLRRHDDGIVLYLDEETCIDELVGKKLIVPVRELGF